MVEQAEAGSIFPLEMLARLVGMRDPRIHRCVACLVYCNAHH